jgi:hypothetical protein
LVTAFPQWSSTCCISLNSGGAALVFVACWATETSPGIKRQRVMNVERILD